MGNALVPIQFHNNTIYVLPGPDEHTTWIPLKPICDLLGISIGPQIEKMKGRFMFAERYKDILIPSAGGPQMTFCVSLSRFNAWVFLINEEKVRAESREMLGWFQNEIADLIYRYCFEKHCAVTNTPLAPEVFPHAIAQKLDLGLQKLDGLTNIAITGFSEIKSGVSDLTQRVKVYTPRKSLSESDKAFHRSVVTQAYRGVCPCCHDTLIVEDGAVVNGGEYDHALTRSAADLHSTWLICSLCNTKRKSGKFIKETQCKFENYQWWVKKILSETGQQGLPFEAA